MESLELLILDSLEIKIIIIAAAIIGIVSIWTIYERIDERGWKSLIPFYRWVVLFRGVGLSPWLSLLMVLLAINLIVLVVLYIYMTRVFKRSYFFVLGLVFLPFIFIPIIAFGEGRCDHYQPHARFVDVPIKSGTTGKVEARSNKANSSTPLNRTMQHNEITPARIVPDKVASASEQNQPASIVTKIRVLDEGKDIKVTQGTVSKKRYMDFARTPRKMKVKTAKPLSKVIALPARKHTIAAEQTKKSLQARKTRPMPGDIRSMKNNVVVVGTLTEAPAPTRPNTAPSLHQVDLGFMKEK
ncbi:MAG: hypothetical protein IJT08_02605 [Alphaproteobacteria bacterium]|nr:hypothetical protein [Alphaproteobacteria bacterium]